MLQHPFYPETILFTDNVEEVIDRARDLIGR